MKKVNKPKGDRDEQIRYLAAVASNSVKGMIDSRMAKHYARELLDTRKTRVIGSHYGKGTNPGGCLSCELVLTD